MSKLDQSTTNRSLNLNYENSEEGRGDQYYHLNNHRKKGWNEGHRRSKNDNFQRISNSHSQHHPERNRQRPSNFNRSKPKGFFEKWGEQLSKIKSLASSRRFEGPKSLRAMSFCGGIACTTTSILAITNFQMILMNPPSSILLIYQIFFGLTAMIIEAKNLKMFESTQPWINTWFPFLMEPVGKGFFFILTGVLGISLWQHFLPVACSGGFMCMVGFLYLIVSCGGQQKLSRVGIELTQHPGRGGYSKLPNLGQHRTKSGERFPSPQFGNHDMSLLPQQDSEMDSHEEGWMDDDDSKMPLEFQEGLQQYKREMYHAEYNMCN